MNSRQNRAFRLRNMSTEELQRILNDHKEQLAELRVNKVASGVASKLAKIRVVRKLIARQLTVLNQKRRQEIKDAFATRAGIKEYNEQNKTAFSLSRVPKELRPRKTRALRKKITKAQREKLLPKQLKRRQAFPQRSYAVKA